MDKEEIDFQKDTDEAKKRALETVRQKLHNFLQLKISPANSDGSLLSDEDYKTQKQTLEQEVKTLEKEAISTGAKAQEADQKTIDAVSFTVLAQEQFKAGDPKRRRDFFMGLGSHPTLVERKVRFNSPKYLETIAEMKNDVDEEVKRVAPNFQLINPTQMGALFSSIPSVLRG